MDPFVDHLASLCREHVTRNKWVFVPSHAIGNTLGERIALDGTNWLNLRFVTPLDAALRMGAPFLVERGIDPSEEGLGPALIMRLLLDLPTEGGYFRPLADQPTMAQALWTTIHELRMAGVKSDDLKPGGFESAAKHAELQTFLAAYEGFLAGHGRGDMATVYEEAVKHPDWCPIQAEDCWTELPDHIWSPLQRRLIEQMPGERILPKAVIVPGATLPRRLAGQQIVRVEAQRKASPLAFLLAPVESALESQGNSGSDPIQLFHAGGREGEIEEVFRRILASGAPLDQVEIACAPDAHLLLVWEKALRRDWPVTLGPGIAAALTRPGRALIGFCDWIEADFGAGHLRRLLQSGDMGIEEDDEGFTAGQAARTLARAEAGWGRATYDLSLGALQNSYSTSAGDPDLSADEREAAQKKAHLTGQIRTWITKLIGSVPGETDGRAPLQDVVNAAVAFLERSTSRVSALDHRSAAALVDYLKELQALGPFACSLGEALRFIRERVESLQVAPDRPRPGHLYACRLQQAAYSGRPHLYVVGLEEGRVFPSAAEDPVLLDAERATISPDLKLSRDRIDEAVYSTLARLASWSGHSDGVEATATSISVTLSYSCRDTREFRETFASWLMLQAFRLQQGNGALTYHDMKAALGEPVSCVPRERSASTEGSWWLRSVVGTGDEGIEAVEGTFTALARGRKALESRESEAFTEYDGHVPDAGSVLDPCSAENSFSVTDLETAATCPFRFFLKRGLGLRPVDEGEREKDIWLDPLTRGIELHDVYAALLRRCRAENRRADVSTDGPWLTKYAQDVLDRLNREMPPATSEILARETRDFLADVELFLEAESEPSTSEPIGFEVSFGRPLDDEGEELAREEPVEVDLGGGLVFRIAGRVDRIDKVGPSEFHIIDYKTGGFWRDDWKGTFNGGRRLQHALYGLAAVELLRGRYSNPRVTGAVYYFPTHKGRRERLSIPAPSRGRIAGVLSDLRECIVSGAFVHAADEKKACKFCDYTDACGDGVHEQAAAKAADPKLLAVGRLGAHE
jgi:ATP-dependent helicase/nuclease subunit B